jgi:hypothetical protein
MAAAAGAWPDLQARLAAACTAAASTLLLLLLG